jgi:hypothetical protein
VKGSVVLSGLISLFIAGLSGYSVTQSPNIPFTTAYYRFASLDLGHLATSFCLVRLPKMPELRESQGTSKNFTPAGPEVNIFGIPFLDKPREVARQKRLAAELAAGGENARRNSERLRSRRKWRIVDKQPLTTEKIPRKGENAMRNLWMSGMSLPKKNGCTRSSGVKRSPKKSTTKAKVESKAEASGSDASSNEDSDSSEVNSDFI